MSLRTFAQRFVMRGVFWRQYLAWAVNNIPDFLEPILLWIWSGFFYIVWPSGRRAVNDNLRAIFPDKNPIVRFWRGYLVFLNFAWTFTDTMRFHEHHQEYDWEFVGLEHFRELSEPGRPGIILTAHMGNYDLGAYLFAERTHRQLTMVRVPERDRASEEHSTAERRKAASAGVKINYNLDPTDIALGLIDALRRGEIVAIQGDRVLPGVAGSRVTFFGKSAELPAGPFALASATRSRIYPLFIVRVGRRRYRLIAEQPIECGRSAREREAALAAALSTWQSLLESIIRRYWFQWFAFEPFYTEDAKP